MTSAFAWRAALRIARRDAWRHRGRSALVIAMVLVPVLGLSCADVLARTMQLSPSEKLTRTIGQADVGFSIYGGFVQQGSDPLANGAEFGTPPGYHGPHVPLRTGTAAFTALEQRALSAIGATAAVTSYATSTAIVKAGDRQVAVNLTAIDLTNRLTGGIAKVDHGTAPAGAHDAAVTQPLADRLGVGIGGQITLGGTTRQVTAIVSQTSSPKDQAVFVLPGTARFARGPELTFLADTVRPVSWATVQQLNKIGVAVESRQVALHPPKGSSAAYKNPPGRLATRDAVGIETVAVGMAILEVCLLAGAAFAVGVRRQRHDLALVGAVGGDARTVRAVVLGTGLVLGVVGAVLGVALGIAFAPAVLPFIAHKVDRTPGHFDLRPLELFAVALLGAVTGVLAAWLPSRTAARDDVVLALTGRRGVQRSQKRVPVVGVAMIVAGIVVAVQATHHYHFRVILAGAVLAELGFVVCAPALVGLVGRLGRFVGLAPRLALRDAARHRGRSGPAVAAIMAAVAGTIAVSTYLTTTVHDNRADYQPQGRIGQPVLEFGSATSAAQLANAAEVLRSGLGASKVVQLRTVDCFKVGKHCSPTDAQATGTGSLVAAIGGPDVLTALLGRPDPQGAAALEAGDVVLFQRDPLTSTQFSGIGANTSRQPLRAVPTYNEYVGTQGSAAAALISPATAAKFKAHDGRPQLLAITATVPTQSAVDQTALRLPVSSELYVERGYSPGPYSVGLIVLAVVASLVTLGATAVAVGLSMVESKPDLMTLSAVGGRPLTRRLLVASQAGTISVLGAVQGVVSGLIPAWAILRAVGHVHFVLPWTTIAVVVIGIPLLAMIGTAATAGSRLSLDRRLT